MPCAETGALTQEVCRRAHVGGHWGLWGLLQGIFARDAQAAGQGQRGDGVLGHQGRQAPKVGLAGTALDLHAFGSSLNEKVADQLFRGVPFPGLGTGWGRSHLES